MSTSNVTGFISFTALSAISYGTRVKLNSDGQVIAAGVAEKGIGVTLADAADLGGVTVQLYSQGTINVKTTTADTVDVGDVAYAAADGLVSSTATTPVTIGIYRESADANLDYVEVIPS
jgi:hypothetical protein